MAAEPDTPPSLPEGAALQRVGPSIPAFVRASARSLAIDLRGQWDWKHSNTPNWHATNNRFTGAFFVESDGSWELNGLAYYTNGRSQPYSLQFASGPNVLHWVALENFRHGFSNVTTTNPEVRVSGSASSSISVVVRRRFAFQNTFFVLEAGSYIEVSVR